MSVIDDYLAGFSGVALERLTQLREVLREELPEAEEVLSYGLATFDVQGKHVVHFGGFKNHVGFYPTPSGTQTFQERLGPFKKNVGSIQFQHDEPLPLDLVREIARFRHQEVLTALAKPKKKSLKTDG